MDILGVLDACAQSFTFPMLDNGYVYLGATRLSLFRSAADWAMVIEVFGFSPRAGVPDLHVHTFASKLWHRDAPEKYVTHEAYEAYLAANPHNESRFFFPIAEGPWQDEELLELVARDPGPALVRGEPIAVPPRESFARHGIELEDQERIQVFELCRYLAAVARDRVLATEAEQRVSVPPELVKILQLEDWNHPDLVNDVLPRDSECFQQLARVLATGDVGRYLPTVKPNTHWRNWPEGGRL
jgi:hypothetical protein